LRSAADGIDRKLTDVEDNLIQRKLTGQGQDSVRWPPKLVSKIGYLARGVGDSDFGPTAQQREVQSLFEAQLSQLQQQFKLLLSRDLEDFNKLLRERNIGNIISRDR